MGDQFPTVVGDAFNIFHRSGKATRGNLNFFLFQFKKVSRYMSISDFPKGFKILVHTLSDEVDGNGDHFVWFLQRFGPTLLKCGVFDKVLKLAKDNWELEEKLEAIGVDGNQIKVAVEAMGGVLSVEDNDPSPNYEDRDEELSQSDDDDVDWISNVSDGANDTTGGLEDREIGVDELTALAEDLNLDLGTIWKRLILERKPVAGVGDLDDTVVDDTVLDDTVLDDTVLGHLGM